MNSVIPIVIIPILVNRLGTENYGIIAFAQYFAAILMFACDYGFVYTGPQQVSQHQEDKHYLNRLFSAITYIKMGLFVLSLIITIVFCFAFKGLSPNESKAIYISLFAVMGNVLTPVWFLQGVQQLRTLTIITVMFKLVQLLLLVFCVSTKTDLELAFWIFIGSNFLLGLAVFIYTVFRFSIHFNLPEFGMILLQLKKGFSMFLAVFFSSIYIHGTGLLLGILTGNNQLVAHYSAGEKIVRAITYLFNPFVQAFFPFISKMFLLNREMGITLFFKFFKFIFLLTSFVALMVFLSSSLIVEVLLEKSFEPTITIVCILCPIIVFGNAGNLLGNNLFMQMNWERVTVWVTLFLAGFSTITCVVLIQNFEANGAAISLSITEVLAPLLFIGYYRWRKSSPN